MPHDRPSDVIIYVDGASRGNPGTAGIGVSAHRPDGTPVLSEGTWLGVATNNVAEYAALAYALFLLQKEFSGQSLHICADSLLLVKQFNGEYRVKNERLAKWHGLVKLLAHPFSIRMTHVRRERNSAADALANQGIDLKTLPESDFVSLLKRHNIAPQGL